MVLVEIVLFLSSPEPKAHWWAYRISRVLLSVCMLVCMYVVCMSTFSNISSEITEQIEAKFHMEPLGMWERKFVQTVLVTWPRWPPCTYMVKTIKNLFLQNQMADDFETCNKWPKWQDVPVGIKKYCPQEVVSPAPGLCTCIKSWEKLYKIRLQSNFFETYSKWPKWQEDLLT